MESILSPATVLLVAAWSLAIALLHYTYRRKLSGKSVSFTKLFSKTTESTILPTEVKKTEKVIAPGPKPYPFIGNIPQLAKYEENP